MSGTVHPVGVSKTDGANPSAAQPGYPPSYPTASTAQPGYPPSYPTASTAQPGYPPSYPTASTAQPGYPTSYPAQQQHQQPPPPPAYPAAGGYQGQPAQHHLVVMQQQPVVVNATIPRFNQSPVWMVCPNCHNNVQTTVYYKIGGYTWLIAAILFFVGLSLGCCLIPFCVNSCKDVEHICPSCNRMVGRFHRL
ncbi:hypothetical protein BOX15_Mlig032667g1 [Macrostomum lignano]|uniref:LITAF domain-containing protein n=1 Tax=Macrostomum lignano TaxID=282301 RepID=A0A267FU76_9PLAT|nr:hypothetical protein BOX15_Mlig032667g1 [Macrostomum lignano]